MARRRPRAGSRLVIPVRQASNSEMLQQERDAYQRLSRDHRKLLDLLREIARSGVETRASGVVKYVVVIDRETWREIQEATK